MVESKDSSVMRVLFKLSAWVGKAYVFPTQSKLVKLCDKWCSAKMSRRTLNRVLSRLESGQFIERVRRHRRGADNQLIFHSTLYKLQARAFNWAYGVGAWSSKIFGVFRVPKLAQYRVSTPTGYLSHVDKPVDGCERVKGGAARNAPIILQFRTV